RTFERILPLLMFAAAAIFTFGPRVSSRRLQSAAKAGEGKSDGRQQGLALVFGALVQLLISTYGGYFGGGMGIVMLATFTLMGMTHMHEMNALKVVLGLLINGVAVVAFLVAGKVVMSAAIFAAVGSIVGGWSGAALARRVDPKQVRKVVLLV